MTGRAAASFRAAPLALLVATVTCGASTTGCGLADVFAGDRVNPEVPSWYNRPSAAMHIFVHRELTASSRSAGEDWERGRPEVDPDHNRLFIGSSDHGLYALRASDGSTIWRFETASLVQSEALYDRESDLVYFGSNDGALYCVRASDGHLVFRFDTGAEVSRKPVRAGDSIFVANASDYLFALDRRTGKPRWNAHRTPALGMEISGHAGPSVDLATGTVFMAYSDGHVAAYDSETGKERWTPVDLAAEAEQAGGDAPRYLDVDTTPLVDEHPQGHVIYVSSYVGGIFALDAATGARLWSNDKSIGVTDLVLYTEQAHKPNPNGPDRGGPAVPARKVLLASSATSGLQGLDPYTGRVLWRNKVPEGGITAPVPVAGAVIVGTTRYGLFLLSPRNGKVIDGIDLGSGFAQTPAAFSGRAYAMTNAGTLIGVAISPPAPLAQR